MMGLADVEDLEGLSQCACIGDVLADVVITDSAAEPPKTMMPLAPPLATELGDIMERHIRRVRTLILRLPIHIT